MTNAKKQFEGDGPRGSGGQDALVGGHIQVVESSFITPLGASAPAASTLKATTFTWRRPYVMAARVVFNVLYRLSDQRDRADEVVFISRQSDEPRYDYAMLAAEFERRGWQATMHLKKVRMRDLAGYVGHVLTEIRLLGRCKVAVLDRYDPVVSLIDFECDDSGAQAGGVALGANGEDRVNVDFPRKPIVLQLWHAFGAFKKFGLQTVDMPEGHPRDFIRGWRIHHNSSWVVCSGEGARTAFAEAFSVPRERVLPLNRPEYDKLLALRGSQSTDERSRVRVLMAPTLRKSHEVPHPMRDLYAVHDAFEAAVDADVVWAFHPLEEGLPAPGDVSGELLECDVVVTDYSSLVYEAYVLGKAVVFYVPDIGSYRITPGLNRDPLELCPAICARDAGELVELLHAVVSDPSNYDSAALWRFIGDAFSASSENDVAVRIVDFLMGHL